MWGSGWGGRLFRGRFQAAFIEVSHRGAEARRIISLSCSEEALCDPGLEPGLDDVGRQRGAGLFEGCVEGIAAVEGGEELVLEAGDFQAADDVVFAVEGDVLRLFFGPGWRAVLLPVGVERADGVLEGVELEAGDALEAEVGRGIWR